MNKEFTKSNNFIAFTIAEILIVLGIVGIIAEITIPMLIKDTEKQIAITKVKQIYSILTQANNSLNAECSGNALSCLSNINAADDNQAIRTELANLYKTKFSIMKDCTTGTPNDCFANVTYKGLDNNNDINIATTSYLTYSAMVLKNGTSICFDWDGANYSPRYFRIIVDLNNVKLPNQYGKDTFWFEYDYNKRTIVPWRSGLDCTSGNSGRSCSRNIILENAINYY